ncbi:MAG: formyltetrahydrofolate deformylase [Candidatus Hydrogenedentota bacterium]
METVILLIQCQDQQGIVARVSERIFRHGGNITDSDQYTTDPFGGWFIMRLEFAYDPERVDVAALRKDLDELAHTLNARFSFHYARSTLRMGVLVSKFDHCLEDLLYRRRSGELQVDIPWVISNHPDLEDRVTAYGVPFHHVPFTKETQDSAEQAILEIARDSTDFLVLARFMRILSTGFLDTYGKDVINIHHSFLPSFKGADPYRQAYDRGVKVIGATAHFATADLDEGPIIEQLVERVSHKDDVKELKRKGRSLEKQALANAVLAYIQHRIIRLENKTVVF